MPDPKNKTIVGSMVMRKEDDSILKTRSQVKEEIKRADKVVKPFNVRKIKKSAFEFFPDR